jgi:hypothetical protein
MDVNTTRDFWPPDSLMMGVRWCCPSRPKRPSIARICSGLSPASGNLR